MHTKPLGVLVTIISAGVALLLGLHSSSASPAAVYYVDAANGSDAEGNGSQASPWRTITWALSHVSSGNTVTVLPGTYNTALGESFPLNLPSGVSLTGSGRDTTIIAGQGSAQVLYIGSETADVFSDTVVSNLALQGGSIGLAMHATQYHTVAPLIIGLRIHGNTTGIQMTTSGVYENGATTSPVISDTQVISNAQTGIYMRSYGYFSPSSIAPVISESVVRGNGGYGIHVEASAVSVNGTSATPRVIATRIVHNGGHGIFATGTYQGWAKPQIERSWITDNTGYGFYWENGINGGNFDAGITNTVISKNQGGGIFLDLTSGSTAGSICVVNSTLAENANYGILWHQSGVDPLVINSILWNPNADDLYSTGSPWTATQVRYSDIEDGDLSGEAGNFSANPLFLDAYHIGACSPAMNAGTGIGAPLDDIDGDLRPLGSAPDVGVDEFEAPCLLNLSKSVSAEQARLGDVLTYTIRLTNTTVITPFNVLMTDALPLPLELDSAWASQGTPTYASGIITWSDTIMPGAAVTIGLQARIVGGSTTIRNSVAADAGVWGLYRSLLCETWVEPTRIFLPFVTRNYCTGPILDDFGNPASGWPIAETASWSYGYFSGEYRLYAKRAQVFGAVSRGEYRQDGSLIMEVDARQSSSVNGSLGIVYALNDDWSQFYTFEIYPATQQYAVFQFSGGQWSLVTYGSSSAIQPGQSTNRLRLVMQPLTFLDLYVNGVFLVAPQPYNPFAGYRVGLTATSDAAGFDARFDNYKLVPEGCPENPLATEQAGQAPDAFFDGARESRWDE